jgi:hypothetical protein
MVGANLYFPLWRKYLPVLAVQMKNARNGLKTMSMSEAEFVVYGHRPSSGFGFNLEVNKGKVSNDISGSAVARDLFEVLIQNENTKQLLKEDTFKFSMGVVFQLKITTQ